MAVTDDLVSRVRLLISDPSGASQQFTDAEILNALKRRSSSVRYYPLAEKPTISEAGVVTYVDFEAPVGDWDTGVVLTDGDYDVLTPTSSDYVTGDWSFATEPDLPVLITGTTYDLYGTAGDLLMQWHTAETCAFDISADDIDLKRSQKAEMKKAAAYAYYAKARTTATQLVRTDEV
jgi:hypothetical protein